MTLRPSSSSCMLHWNHTNPYYSTNHSCTRGHVCIAPRVIRYRGPIYRPATRARSRARFRKACTLFAKNSLASASCRLCYLRLVLVFACSLVLSPPSLYHACPVSLQDNLSSSLRDRFESPMSADAHIVLSLLLCQHDV